MILPSISLNLVLKHKKENNMDFKHELEYYLYILNDNSLSYQDKVEVLEEKIKERLKNMWLWNSTLKNPI